jgi:hypothetical protein
MRDRARVVDQVAGDERQKACTADTPFAPIEPSL